MRHHPYVPAAGRDWLLPLYDPLLRLLRADRIKGELIDLVGPKSGDRVLDLGCGTGSLALLLCQRCPEVAVCGLDPDPRVLTRARRKAARASLEIEWHQGFADELPFEDASFDHVVSSFVFHHLPPEVVRATVPEIRRVLRPGGSLHVLDFGAASHGLHGLLARFASHQHADEDAAGELPAMLERAGLVEVSTRALDATFVGRVLLTAARAPETA